MVCLNDSPLVGDRFPEEQARIQRAFDRILPEKSGYER